MPDLATVVTPDPAVVPVVIPAAELVAVAVADPASVVLTTGPNWVWSIVHGGS